jgi:hypothetical protein
LILLNDPDTLDRHRSTCTNRFTGLVVLRRASREAEHNLEAALEYVEYRTVLLVGLSSIPIVRTHTSLDRSHSAQLTPRGPSVVSCLHALGRIRSQKHHSEVDFPAVERFWRAMAKAHGEASVDGLVRWGTASMPSTVSPTRSRRVPVWDRYCGFLRSSLRGPVRPGVVDMFAAMSRWLNVE